MAASVFWHANYLAGAPQLTNAWGSLTALLDACLVNGYGVKTIATLTSTVAGVATATVTGGHAFVAGQVVEIAGCAQANYNGRWTVLSAQATSFTFQLDDPGSIRTATTTTSITAKTPSLGWSKPNTGTNRGAYRAPTGNRNLLVVDNSQRAGYDSAWAKWASVGIASAISGINPIVVTGIQAPYDPTNPARNWTTAGTGGDWGWAKWIHARQYGWLNEGDGGAGNRDWLLVGDGVMFYLWVKVSTGWGGFAQYAFGDVSSYVAAGDATGTVLVATESANEDQPGSGNSFGLGESLAYAGKWLLRNHTQQGLPVKCAATPALHMANGVLTSGRGPMQYPHGPDNGLWLTPTLCVQEGMNSVRGTFRGLYWMPQYKPVGHGAVFDQVVRNTTRRMMAVAWQGYSEGDGVTMAIDLTGPWT
ncbi:hypothetical protein VITFI_CDS3246 [Vitreoscilla filiformis]|jgi:hypothetical protein|uniref:Uncharacterized protein n=1 Tax=Vitreoscilla filiformis TaxID=63 RepID=A0A221KEU4_VITFI|nr:hypothetical protein [Vitreoscilla filiformis]ASM75878.1 hypothetical protein VITFI_CDS0099 [Vitreoscilla filiformis]ASM76827.1 hypothetical protein VITFI_CDS1049 [Vitreoscilla filiformis]ASM77323.1 hypothetical protein VITFI_CDS1545 [Vitreoscilla filiformis]ASM79023.1 hypothetical protein VITFI_CDS3246 [Vitreoscilla filiformis]